MLLILLKHIGDFFSHITSDIYSRTPCVGVFFCQNVEIGRNSLGKNGSEMSGLTTGQYYAPIILAFGPIVSPKAIGFFYTCWWGS